MSEGRLPVTVLSGFLGVGIDWPVLKSRLDGCLIPKEQASSLDDLQNYPDPFPTWRRAGQVA